jgi:hypothetical protein
MLRLLVVFLIVANALFFAWTQGAMDQFLGLRSTGDREPERRANQIRPADLVVLPARTVGARVEPSRLECLEAGPWGSAEIATAQQAASELISSAPWSRRQVDLPGVWVVLMGPFSNQEALAKKMEELKRIRIEFEEITDLPAFKFSLALGGRHSSAQAASKVFAALTELGLKSGAVTALKAPSTQWFLRLENADAAQAKQLRALQGPLWGAGWSTCS